ncbi:MAG: autotransporter-associated beta strand repeat-containing protein, partial [Tepidisphaeraceae bacterium]
MHKKLNLFGGWFGLPGKRRAKKSGRSAGTARRLPQIEPLEKRWLLSVVTWTGGGADNQFGTAANWSTGTVPTGNDNVVIPADAGTLLVVGAAAVTSLEIQGDGVTLQGGTGASIAVSGGNIIVDSGTAVIAVALAGCNGLSKQGAGTLELSAPNSYSGDTTVNAGSLVLDSGVSLSDGNGLSVAAGTTLALGNLNGGTPVFSRALPARFAPDATPDLSTAGVVYANGGVIVTADDLGLGTTRTYDNRQNPTQSGGLGSGWTLDGQPYVAANSNRAAVVLGPTQSYWFSNNAPLFTPLDGAKETLTADTADHLLDFAMPDGTVYTFNDFSYSDALAGQFVARYSPGGGIERVTATADDGQIAAIRWQVSASAAPYQAEIFSYDTAAQDPANVGRLESIVLQGYDGTSLVNTREVSYAYYNGTADPSNGVAGDLESATEQFWDPTLN